MSWHKRKICFCNGICICCFVFIRASTLYMSTCLKPIFGLKPAIHVSDNFEGSLNIRRKTLLKEAFWLRRFERPNKKSREIHEVLQKLKKYGSVCVTIDKTKCTSVIQVEEHKWWVSVHLLKAFELIHLPKVIALFVDANKLLKKVKMDLSVQEENVWDNHSQRDQSHLKSY